MLAGLAGVAMAYKKKSVAAYHAVQNYIKKHTGSRPSIAVVKDLVSKLQGVDTPGKAVKEYTKEKSRDAAPADADTIRNSTEKRLDTTPPKQGPTTAEDAPPKRSRYSLYRTEQEVAYRISKIKDSAASLQEWKNEAYCHYVAYSIMTHPQLYVLVGATLVAVGINIVQHHHTSVKKEGGALDVDSFLRTSTNRKTILQTMHNHPQLNIGLKCIQYGDALCLGAIATLLGYYGITWAMWRREPPPAPAVPAADYTEFVRHRQALGLGPDFTPENCSYDELRKAFRKAARRAHPDRGGNPDAFRAVKAAYDFFLNWHDS